MATEYIEQMQDAWLLLRDVSEVYNIPELVEIMNRLHELIDREMEAQE